MSEIKNSVYDETYTGKIRFEELSWVPNSYQFASHEQAMDFLNKIQNNPNIRNVRVIE